MTKDEKIAKLGKEITDRATVRKIFVSLFGNLCFDIGKFFLCLVAIYLMLTFAQKQNMTETIHIILP